VLDDQNPFPLRPVAIRILEYLKLLTK
jgi:hypothetical protein